LRLSHYETFRPVCPLCKSGSRLDLTSAAHRDGGTVFEGILTCSNAQCLCEYPIIGGIPVIVPNVRACVSQGIMAIVSRDDLEEDVESLLGDCCGPNSPYDTNRQHLSAYAFDHYGDLDPASDAAEVAAAGSALRVLAKGLAGGPVPEGPALDAGCSVGRTTFALAETRDDLVLGIDLNFGMLRLAARVLHEGLVRYPKRRVGMVYERREFEVSSGDSSRVDFWMCDATALPFAGEAFALATSINVLDCVSSPYDHLLALESALQTGGMALIATPYDWSPGATAVEAWIGGHSQRSSSRGSSEALLRSLLGGGHPQGCRRLRLVSEVADVPWSVRLHDRSTMSYRLHLVIAQKTSA
jgi:SAM-dependent methyltransferase/uncharacterized protein YbaR (Trm112 family)